MNLYKIKVGIEEYSVDEVDIPRIVEAMKNNDIVKLDCGLFRGQSILAVCRDFEKEIEQRLLETSKKEETPQSEKEKTLAFARKECLACEHTGWVKAERNKMVVMIPCECQITS